MEELFFVQGSFSSMEKCLYGKTITEHMINYATQFWEKYQNNILELYLIVDMKKLGLLLNI